jgi:hypothetical protein
MDEDEEDSEEMEEKRGGANYADAESKFAKQAMAQMEDEEEEEAANQQQDQPEEGGIRLGKRRGPKKAKGGVERSGAHKKVITQPKVSVGGKYDEKDIEFMKNAIQALCQSANKSIDFVSEDIDSMVKEYQQ